MLRSLVLFACAFAWGTLTGAATAGVDLRGRVVDAHGAAVPGATVVLYTAGPRVGVSTFCPSCYPDCGKHRETGRDGRFTIPALSESLQFRVLVVAGGIAPTFASGIDPLRGPVEIVVRPRDEARDSIASELRGRVVDPDGEPVVGAIVECVGLRSGPGTRFGQLPGVDALAVSDAGGEFRLASRDSADAWVVRVRARALAPQCFPDVVPAGEAPVLRLTRGALVTGVVLDDERPAAGAVVGIRQLENDAASFTGADTIAADARGRFTFVNVPPDQDFVLYGVVEALRPRALRTTVITVGDDDSVTTVPPLPLEWGHRLAGRIVVPDGRPLPPGTHLLMGRSLAWDSSPVPLNADGRFEIDGVPPETVYLNLRIPGYRISRQNPGYTRYRGVRVPMVHDRTGVEVVMERDEAPAGRPRP
jgi:hypothetical protein